MKRLLYGRELILSEIPEQHHDEMKDHSEIIKSATYFEKRNKQYCNRCQTQMAVVKPDECFCEKECAYCRNCLQMGKVRACEAFYYVPEPNAFSHTSQKLLEWQGELSKQQKSASEMIIETIKQNETRLLWAVAGAGKTEMLFPGIEYALLRNKRVCIATPRVDVVLELAPRIKEAFPKVPVSVLYGGMEAPYVYTALVIATTHQLYRFKEAFDVLIIDEIDAFPFHLDDSLQYAAQKARKKTSALIYLSATPDKKMQKEVKQNRLLATILPARYHGHGLPVPQTRFCSKWHEKVLSNPMATSFGKEIKRLIKEDKRFLVFAPNIQWMLELDKVLRVIFPNVSFDTVSAEDDERKEKVIRMRQEQVQFLISTTILERGVTFPNIDVLVIGAEDRVFTEAALVQIAGRAGRSPKYPKGNVIYFHNGQSLAMKKAIKQIKSMNDLARKKGLIQ